jgi:hypothetical protein
MKNIRTIAALVLFVAALSAQESVAVLPPLAGKNVGEMTKKVVRSAFSDCISAPGSGYTAYNRDHTDLLVKELGEQGGVLYDEKSAKELGMRMGVQYVCISELTKDEDEFLIECKLINVETGATKTESEFVTKSTNDVVRKASVAAIKRLLGMGGEEKGMVAVRTEPAPPTTGKGTVQAPTTASKPAQAKSVGQGKANNETAAQRGAVRQAKQYLGTQGFSRRGLIDQLKFEGFTNEEATYGADNVNADWMEQSAIKAKQYLDIMGFSRGGLINQLEFEGFTNEEAAYGARAAGL